MSIGVGKAADAGWHWPHCSIWLCSPAWAVHFTAAGALAGTPSVSMRSPDTAAPAFYWRMFSLISSYEVSTQRKPADTYRQHFRCRSVSAKLAVDKGASPARGGSPAAAEAAAAADGAGTAVVDISGDGAAAAGAPAPREPSPRERCSSHQDL